jgi:hypothetical protein
MTTPDNDKTVNRLGECTDAAIEAAVARDAVRVEAEVADVTGKITEAVETLLHQKDADRPD